MGKTSGKSWKWLVKTGCLVSSLFFLWGCVAGQQQGNNSVQSALHSEKRTLISIASMSGKWGVQLTANEDLRNTYTAIKQAVPRGVVLYLPETAIGGDVKDIVPESGPITYVSAHPVAENVHTVKVEVLVKQAFEYKIIEQKKALQIVLYVTSSHRKAHAPANPPDEGDETLAVAKDEQGNTVIFTQEKLPLDSNVSANSVPDSTSDTQNSQKNIPMSSYMVSDGFTHLTDISFTTKKSGASTILVKTGIPVGYDLQRVNENEIKLFLKNTKIPKYRQRPLITTYFNSAVERVLPVQPQGDHKPSYVLIQLRHRTPYRISRDENVLSLVFDPAPITVPEFKQARVVLNKDSGQRESADQIPFVPAETLPGAGGGNENMNSSVSVSGTSSPVETPMETSDQKLFSIKNAPQYTGEKISLDFYETDIKNVFRILQTVSGENFAIDKDVTGNVTLALDKPVPWDQVLDLVLKMNGLGKVKEGNIIRIATQTTLNKEFKFQEEALAAKQRAVEKKKKLEPLVTEYIPINYSNADADIKPHLEKLLTPERGQLSVDTRTNMIIITDVREKINQAKELIHRLDTVTPQIMIEARVVEVSKNFSRDLGVAWGVSTSKDSGSLGGTYGFDVAMNYPVASDSSLSYTFDRIVGTPLSINATLSAAEAKGDAKIISSPRILTLDNKEASIKQGLQYAYLERDDTGGSSVKFKDIDLLLEVKPQVTPDNRVSMSIHITKNDLDSVTDGVPSLSTNEAKTELLVNDGNTIVIGGIVKTTSSNSSTGFPFLSDIPILGHLFRSDSDSEKKNELLIFLTPTIVQLEQKNNSKLITAGSFLFGPNPL